MTPPLCPLSFGKSVVQRLPQLQGSERGQKAAIRMQCQPRKRHKGLGTATPEHFHSPATAIRIPQLHFCCANHRSRVAALTLYHRARKVLVTGLRRSYSFLDTSLLPNPTLHCLFTCQGLPCSYHEGLLHYDTLCPEDIP